jgi:hypothetical protein
MPSATYGYLAAIVPAKKTRTLLHVAPASKLVEGKLSITHKSATPVRVRIGVSSGALITFSPSNYILYDLQIGPGETYETDTIYYANNQSLIVYSDDATTSFLLTGDVVDNPVDSGFLNSIKVLEAKKNIVLYTMQQDEEAEVSIFISNQGSTRTRFRVGIKDQSQATLPSSNYLNYNSVIFPRTFYQRTGIKISGGQQIIIWAEDPNVVSFALYGKFNYNIVSTDFSVNGNFTVVLDADLQSDVTVGGDLTVDGETLLKDNTVIEGSLGISGPFKLGSNLADPSAQITSGGNLLLDGGATINSALSVGTNFSVAETKFTITGSTGNVSMQGNLNILGGVSTNLNLLNNRVTNLARPIAASDAATKGFVDSQITALAIALS